MTRFCDASHEHDYYVCVSKVSQADRKEWLYDTTWFRQDGNRLTDVELVLECERNYFSGVCADFEKLLLVRSYAVEFSV